LVENRHGSNRFGRLNRRRDDNIKTEAIISFWKYELAHDRIWW